MLYNNAKPDDRLLKKYAKDGEFWVKPDEDNLHTRHYVATGENFVYLTEFTAPNYRQSDSIASIENADPT